MVKRGVSRELERAADALLARFKKQPYNRKRKRAAKARDRDAASVGVLRPAKAVRVESTTTVHRKRKSFRKN